MAKAYFLSEDDVIAMREILADWRIRRRNTPNRPGLGSDDGTQTPDVYVALTPSGGIPARVGATAGMADCDVYTIDRDTGEMTQVGEVTQTVFNLSADKVPGNEYIDAKRDKFGAFLAAASVEGPGTGTGTCGSEEAMNTRRTVLADFNPDTCEFTREIWQFCKGKLVDVT